MSHIYDATIFATRPIYLSDQYVTVDSIVFGGPTSSNYLDNTGNKDTLKK